MCHVIKKMRPNIVVVFIVLIVNVETYFIDDFRSAMHHIENGFEKLLTDVVSDMEDTIHCTISAVEHVLIINRILDKTSDFNKKCLDDAYSSSPPNVRDTEHRRQIESGVFDKLPITTRDTEDSYSKHILSQDLHSSIANVNRTLNNILLLKGSNETSDDLLESIRDETNRLSEVSRLLRKELEKISSNVRSELEKINFERESPEAIVWDEIQILRRVENGSDGSYVNDIKHVVENAVSILRSQENSNLESHNNQIEKIIKELEHTDSNLSQDSVQKYKQRDHDSNTISKDFLQITHEENKRILGEDKELNTNNFESKTSNYVSSFFSSFGRSSGEKEAAEEAINLINESKLSNLLFQNENPGSDVFGNANLFNL